MTNKILYWNCCGGLSSKIDSIKHIINSYKPVLFFISECEIKKNTPLGWVSIDNYDFIPSSNYNINKSRLGVYIKQGVVSKIIHPKKSGLEIIAIEIDKVMIIGTYRPFLSGAGLSFREELYSILDEIRPHLSKDVIICGDLNINWKKKKNAEKTIVKDYMDEYSLIQMINGITWRRTVTIHDKKEMRSSVLDLVITNMKVTPTIEDQWTSDHSVIQILVTLNTRNKVSREKHWTRDWKRYDLNNIKKYVDHKLQTQVNDEDLDRHILNIQEEVQTIFCPLRRARTARTTDIVSNNIEKLKKKRKRLLYQYNKNHQERLLDKINELNHKIKHTIKSEKRRLIDIKLKSPNPKTFWHEVKQMQGICKKQEKLELQINGQKTMDEDKIANAFADFFVNKVNTLSNNTGQYNWIRQKEFTQFTNQELMDAIKTFKRKMSAGEDTIMMKIVKDTSWMMPSEILRLMNHAAKHGMPERWKIALVKPLFKKGNKSMTENYRPISNLQSISKLYEKLTLHRINRSYPGIEGDHQHGFRTGRSTCTALLELQDFIGHNLDRNQMVLTYTIDMTAAFDLLRPQIFDMESPFDPAISNQLLDFMTNRKMKVKYGEKTSTEHDITVGCVQGSVLGPKLFSVYCRHLPEKIPRNAFTISYADDSYISFSGSNANELETMANNSLQMHTDYMQSIGMVINQAKTEVVVFSRKDDIKVKLNAGISSTTSLKALGIQFDNHLNWNEHIDKILAKTTQTVKMIKHLRRWLSNENALKVVTSHYFGQSYYCAPLWMNDALSAENWKRLRSQHYRALRAAVGDFRNKISKTTLDLICKRATPRQWGYFISAKTAINLYTKSDTRIANDLRKSVYINDRIPKRAFFRDTSRLKCGRQQFKNRLQQLNMIKFDWIGSYGDDYLRQNLKKTFFTP